MNGSAWGRADSVCVPEGPAGTSACGPWQATGSSAAHVNTRARAKRPIMNNSLDIISSQHLVLFSFSQPINSPVINYREKSRGNGAGFIRNSAKEVVFASFRHV